VRPSQRARRAPLRVSLMGVWGRRRDVGALRQVKVPMTARFLPALHSHVSYFSQCSTLRPSRLVAGDDCGVEAMQALTLMVAYVLTTMTVQFIGFLISRLVDYEYPTLGLTTFLILFLGAFGLAWPVAVRVAEFLIRRGGNVVETEQSGGATRQDHVRTRSRA